MRKKKEKEGEEGEGRDGTVKVCDKRKEEGVSGVDCFGGKW